MKEIPNEKATLRSRLVNARSRVASSEREWAGEALGRLLSGGALPELAVAHTVTAYVPMGSEPGPHDLPEVLAADGRRRVLLPVLKEDNDLDWALWTGGSGLVAARRGLREPTGPLLGPGAVAGAQVLVVPGLAVDRRGMRLGRGGGSYDRALARTAAAPGALTVVLLYDGEVLDEDVPAEPHDRPVDAALTPSGVVRFR